MAKRYQIKATSFDRRGRKIAVGFNTYEKTHPRQKQLAEQCDLHDKEYLHAEIACLIKSRRRRVHRVVIERYDSEDRSKNAAPCPICLLALRESDVRVVEYTIEQPADLTNSLDNDNVACYARVEL